MLAANRSFEPRLLAVLLACVAVFTLWVVPASVVDPEGFGYAQGLAPSFCVYLVAALAAGILVLRLVRVLRGVDDDSIIGPDAHDTEEDGEAPASRARSGVIIGSCLVFAFLLIPYAGFYVSSFAFVVFLAVTMGEQRAAVLILLQALLIAGIYVGFELGFTIVLPRGELMQPLLDAFGG
jgi:hypothetical protein